MYCKITQQKNRIRKREIDDEIPVTATISITPATSYYYMSIVIEFRPAIYCVAARHGLLDCLD